MGEDPNAASETGSPGAGAKRTDYLSWDECFMSMAIVAGLRSKDPNTQVGACIVSADNRILSIGYNGAPNGMPDDSFPWSREGAWLETKYPYVVHAERNAILNYRGSRDNLVGSTLYVALFPCNECAKEIIQSGIAEVVYLSDKHHDSDECSASRLLLRECGVRCRQLAPADIVHRQVFVSLVDDC
ncbi:MAG: dCMP deaminase family protein [Atopobiaceae bacterium]|jgi:dCMP deaminase|nr:dCMP deaminase family protein [Atopobiaceae bacterium]